MPSFFILIIFTYAFCSACNSPDEALAYLLRDDPNSEYWSEERYKANAIRTHMNNIVERAHTAYERARQTTNTKEKDSAILEIRKLWNTVLFKWYPEIRTFENQIAIQEASNYLKDARSILQQYAQALNITF